MSDNPQILKTKQMLREWALYRTTNNGFSPCSSIARLNQINNSMNSGKLPYGVEANDCVYQIIKILEALKKEGWLQEVEIIEGWYLRQPSLTADDFARHLRISRRAFFIALNESILAVAHRYFAITKKST